MKVFLITEGSKHIGFGHITRCIGLYQAFEERGINPELIVHGDESSAFLLKGKTHSTFNWIKEKNRIFALLNKADVAIVDSYLASRNFYSEISRLVKLSVYIDDNKRIKYPKGIVINGSIGAEDIKYPSLTGLAYLVGSKYIILRKEFWDTPEKLISKKVQRVMLTFGGSDRQNITPEVLKAISKKYPELYKTIILGRGFQNIDEIKAVVDSNTKLSFSPGVEKVKKVMLESDIAISAGGQTLYELGRCGVPTIATIIANNQQNNIRGWLKTGFIEFVGWRHDRDFHEKISLSLANLMDFELRKKKSRIGRKYVDGGGSRRIVNYILSRYQE